MASCLNFLVCLYCFLVLLLMLLAQIGSNQTPRLSVQQVRVYIENESIVKSGNTVTLWEKIWIDANGYFIVSNSTYNCKMKTSKDNEAFALERDGSRSKYSLNYPHSDYEYSPVPPDTADEIVFSRLCSSKWYEFWKQRYRRLEEYRSTLLR